MPNDDALYRGLYRIRRFEETVLDEFSSGLFYGTTHTYLGQEANAVGVLKNLKSNDIVFSNHRCHGHFIAYGGEIRALFAELMGKETGVTSGRGGSQHIHWKNFYSNGILGSNTPVGTGAALAEKIKGTDSITIIFLGDGALGQGVVYESLNLASLLKAPVLYVVENNRIAQTTPVELAIAGDIGARFNAFGIPTDELDTSNVTKILTTANEVITKVRTQQSPHALILNTCRFGPHSKGDDTRPEADIQRMIEERDPVVIQAQRLDNKSVLAINKEIDAEVAKAFELAKNDPMPEGIKLLKDNLL